ncbi:hypothetical protein LIER_07282 [Lithospermum erythrorhizon]|uniref:Uncharacterized protein n=1 Tax=Lithospermum erythrorhizon TaxID=34254 RepID=A0AAV3PC90_LITER
MSEAADVPEPSITPSANASEGKTVEPPVISEDQVKIYVSNGTAGNENVSCAEDMMTETVEGPSFEGLGVNVNPSVKDTVDGWKDSTLLEGDVLEPSVANTMAKGMDADIPSVTDIEAEPAENMERPSVGHRVDDILDDDIHEVIPEDAGPKKKSKKRKHKNNADVGESSIPEKKLSKEEKAAKRVRKAERRARRAAQEAANNEEAEDNVPKEVRSSVVQPDVSDEWLPENEPQGGNADEETQDFEEENVTAIMEKRRKAKGKLRMNENRARIGNRRIPKNVAAVSTVNVSLNTKEEQARWRFVANRRIVVEKMLSKVTQKNPNIMSILEEAGVMPTVEVAGQYYPTLV